MAPVRIVVPVAFLVVLLSVGAGPATAWIPQGPTVCVPTEPHCPSPISGVICGPTTSPGIRKGGECTAIDHLIP